MEIAMTEAIATGGAQGDDYKLRIRHAQMWSYDTEPE